MSAKLSVTLLPLLALLPGLALMSQETQGQEAAQELVVTFGSLRYTTPSGQDQSLQAKYLRKISLVRSDDGRASWLELFFQNGDYVYVQVDSVTFYQATTTTTSAKVLVNRIGKDELGWPRVMQ
ncbi:MAG: hypothetical protein R3F30_10155 [Planctomycetota bacterium]